MGDTESLDSDLAGARASSWYRHSHPAPFRIRVSRIVLLTVLPLLPAQVPDD